MQSVPYLAYQVAYNIVASNTIAWFELLALHGAKILQSPVLYLIVQHTEKQKKVGGNLILEVVRYGQ